MRQNKYVRAMRRQMKRCPFTSGYRIMMLVIVGPIAACVMGVVMLLGPDGDIVQQEYNSDGTMVWNPIVGDAQKTDALCIQLKAPQVTPEIEQSAREYLAQSPWKEECQ